MNENVNVCITPKGDKPVLHFSQFDNERVFTVTVLADDGKSAAVLTGLDIEFRLRKTDSHVVTIAPESVADNVITFKTTEQMCACCGQNIATVTLMKDDMVISTLDVLVDIQRDILSGGLTSESDIRNLTTQIEQIVPEVVGDDYYNKSEVDDLIAEHTFDPSNYYDKSEVDDLIAEHTFDPSNYYDKEDVDVLLADKADADDVYTKTETDNLLASLIVQKDVAKAPIASFNTDLNDNLTKCIVDINPVQSGTGTPSPQNVRPISGFTSANITRCGVNFLPLKFYKGLEYNSAVGNTFDTEEATDGSVSGNNVSFNIGSWGRKCMLSQKLPSGVEYRLTMTVTSSASNLNYTEFYLDKDLKVTRKYNVQNSGTSRNVSAGFILNDNECYIAIELGCSSPATIVFDSPMLNVGRTSIAYTHYNGQTYTIAFGQTVYGGVADVTNGEVNVTHGIVDLGALDWISEDSAVSGLAKVNTNQVIPLGAKYLQTPICTHYKGVYTRGYTLFDYGEIGFSNAESAPMIRARSTEFIGKTNAQIKALMSGVMLCYKLANPTEITTTPENLTAISGENNVYGDTNGDTAVRFTETIGNELGV